jgi:hypothetical protein
MLGLSTFVAILLYYFEFYTSLDHCNTSPVDCKFRLLWYLLHNKQ